LATKKVSILFLEDIENDMLLILHELERRNMIVNYQRIETKNEFLSAIEDQNWDVIISDYNLPQFSGLEALRILQERNTKSHFIIYSGSVQTDSKTEIIQQGVKHLFNKNQPEKLITAIEQLIH
jgi:CheY-like chemotaxis protein